jgi:hypothetical protein
MGPQNQSWWRLLNTKSSRHSKIINKTDHPIKGRILHIMPDPCHVIKNMKNALTEGHTFSFGAKTVKKFKLVHPTFDISGVKRLLEFDKKKNMI